MAEYTLEQIRNLIQGSKPWTDYWKAGFDHVIQNKADIGALVGGSAPGWEAAIDTRWSFGETSSSASTYVIAIPDAPTNALYTGAEISVYSINQANTGAATLNVGSTDGAVVIKKRNRIVQGALVNLEAGDLDPSIPARMFFDGTQWVLRNPAMADFLDEDDMASDSATAAPSQQSVKAFGEAGTQLGVHAYTTSDQGIGSATWTKVLFTTERYDVGGNFLSSTYTVGTGEDGRYLIIPNIRFETNTASNDLAISIYINGVGVVAAQLDSGGPSDNTVNCSAVLDLVATDTIDIYAKNQQATDTIRATDSFICVEYMGT